MVGMRTTEDRCSCEVVVEIGGGVRGTWCDDATKR